MQCRLPPDLSPDQNSSPPRPARDRCRKTLSRTYNISISNDGSRYTRPLMYTVYDCKCMRCLSDGTLQQLVRLMTFNSLCSLLFCLCKPPQQLIALLTTFQWRIQDRFVLRMDIEKPKTSMGDTPLQEMLTFFAENATYWCTFAFCEQIFNLDPPLCCVLCSNISDTHVTFTVSLKTPLNYFFCESASVSGGRVRPNPTNLPLDPPLLSVITCKQLAYCFYQHL